MFTLMLFVGLNNNSAHAKYKGHYTTPNELRGNWYQWDKYNHKLSHMRVNKHSIYMNGKTFLKLNDHKNNNTELLNITKYSKNNPHSSQIYLMNSKGEFGDGYKFWLSKKRIHGKRVLKLYYNMGYFMVWTRQKIHQNHSYEYKGENYTSEMGK